MKFFKPFLFHYFLIGLWVIFSPVKSHAQLGATISVNGKHILGPCGDTLLLKGVNYAPYNWGWSPSQLRISEIALSGANAVRLVWYKTPASGTPTTTYNNLTLLDSALSKCIQHQLIPILELHDQTCQNNHPNLITLSSWFTQANVKALINKYKHSLIINIANEALYVNWTGNPSLAQTNFTTTYTTIVNNLRAQQIKVPIMIDGPDCGTNIDVLASVGNTLQNNDPEHNLIFSAHAYWYSFANNDSLTMLNKINNALNQNIPLVLGEIANSQDDATMCQYTLNYKALLNICKNKKLGWLAWSWDNDGCATRQVTTNGLFTGLTTYGQDIIYNSNYGLLGNPVAKSMFLQHGACRITVKAFHEGFYQVATHQLGAVLLNQGVGTNSNLCDSITVRFHNSTSPYMALLTSKRPWLVNGQSEHWVPLHFIGQPYYVSLQHRNSLSTWSSSPITLKTTTPILFTNQANQAYGNNLIYLEPGSYGLHTGDINQDESIDVLDYLLLDTDIVNGNSGYYTTDLNGDGSVDVLDYLIMSPHIIQGDATQKP